MSSSSESNSNSKDLNLKNILDELEHKYPDVFNQAREHGLTLLIVGRAGVGKSSTINTFIGERLANISKFTTGTVNVDQYKSEINGIRFILFDTPGLADPDRLDEETIKQIRTQLESYDCMWFVTQLDESRVRDDEVNTIKKILSGFGNEIWEKGIIVFTHADKVKKDEYKHDFGCRTKLIRKCVAQNIIEAKLEIENLSRKINEKSKIEVYEVERIKEEVTRIKDTLKSETFKIEIELALNIPSIAVFNDPKDDKPKPTPDGKPWLDKLYMTVIRRISDSGFLPMILSTEERVISKNTDQSDGDKILIRLDDLQMETLQKTVENYCKNNLRQNDKNQEIPEDIITEFQKDIVTNIQKKIDNLLQIIENQQESNSEQFYEVKPFRAIGVGAGIGVFIGIIAGPPGMVVGGVIGGAIGFFLNRREE